MSKKYIFSKSVIFILFLVMICSNITFSQTAAAIKFKQPFVNVDILFAYSQPLPGLFGNVQDFFDFKSYGVKTGLGAQINVKLAANKKGTIKPYASLGYNLFMGSDGSNTFIDSNTISGLYPLSGSSRTYDHGPQPGTSKIYLHDFFFAGGFEYDFVNKTRWTPYLGAEVSMNVLFGTYRQTPTKVLGPIGPSEISYTIHSTVRMGFGAAAGIYLRISQPIGFTFCTKYQFANLIGKSSTSTSGPSEVNKMNLLDKANTGLNTYLSKSRNIDYFEFLLGISFNIGKR
jgi:hypothetical protein